MIYDVSASNVLLTTKEVARRLGLSHRSIEGWRLTGQGPPFVLISACCVRYRASDLEDFITRSLRSSTSDPGTD